MLPATGVGERERREKMFLLGFVCGVIAVGFVTEMHAVFREIIPQRNDIREEPTVIQLPMEQPEMRRFLHYDGSVTETENERSETI